MKILVVGSGGREHALTWKLAQSPLVDRIWCAPGNPGMAAEVLVSNGTMAECIPISATETGSLLDFACGQGVDLTVVGPENALALGIVDDFEARGLKIWGPNRQAARFESSKAFSQEFMNRHGIPTARSGVFMESEGATRFADELDGSCVIKADGLALGKGVLICRGPDEARDAIQEVMVKKTFGEAGGQVVIQERLEGMEISMHALCDGQNALLFPSSQDHKRSHDGDQGLNTGGMGAFSPAPFLDEKAFKEVGKAILDPWLEGCRSEGIEFKGLLYPGVMLTAKGPKVLEFNARFGDPETQVYLPRLKNDLAELLMASATGKLGGVKLEWTEEKALCVVMASKGYPGEYVKGQCISGIESAEKGSHVKVFHAGTAWEKGKIVTAGGRVLGVTAWDIDLSKAKQRAYQGVESIRFDSHYRTDIGDKALAVIETSLKS